MKNRYDIKTATIDIAVNTLATHSMKTLLEDSTDSMKTSLEDSTDSMKNHTDSMKPHPDLDPKALPPYLAGWFKLDYNDTKHIMALECQ